MIFIISIFVIAIIILFYKELFLISFDEEHAKASGIAVKGFHFIFIIMVALVIACFDENCRDSACVISYDIAGCSQLFALPKGLNKRFFIPLFLVKLLFSVDYHFLLSRFGSRGNDCHDCSVHFNLIDFI